MIENAVSAVSAANRARVTPPYTRTGPRPVTTAAPASAVPAAVTASSTGTASSRRRPPAPPNAAAARPTATARPRNRPGSSSERAVAAGRAWPAKPPLTPTAAEDTADLRSQGEHHADDGGGADEDEHDDHRRGQAVGQAAGVEGRGAGHEWLAAGAVAGAAAAAAPAAGRDLDRGVALRGRLRQRSLLGRRVRRSRGGADARDRPGRAAVGAAAGGPELGVADDLAAIAVLVDVGRQLGQGLLVGLLRILLG